MNSAIKLNIIIVAVILRRIAKFLDYVMLQCCAKSNHY